MVCRYAHPNARPRVRGFTLVEILIVVVILGILAGIVIPQMLGVTTQARQAAFIREIKVYSDAAMMFRVRTGGFLDAADPGTVPPGFEEYVDARDWIRPTPIGGMWDCLLDDLGVVAAIGVDFGADSVRDDNFMLDIDRTFDDGNLDDGMFRKLAEGQFCYVIEDN